MEENPINSDTLARCKSLGQHFSLGFVSEMAEGILAGLHQLLWLSPLSTPPATACRIKYFAWVV